MSEDYYSYNKSFFKRWVSLYDTLTAPVSRLRETVVDFTNAEKGARVLDVATGTGKQAFAFARRGYEVTAVDLSEDMLRVARKNNVYANIIFEAGDATALRFEDGSFDVVCISFGLHEMPAGVMKKAIDEIARVASQKGSIIVVDYTLPSNKIWRWFAYHIVKSYESKYYPEFIRYDLEILLRNAGIEIRDKKAVYGGMVTIFKGAGNLYIKKEAI